MAELSNRFDREIDGGDMMVPTFNQSDVFDTIRENIDFGDDAIEIPTRGTPQGPPDGIPFLSDDREIPNEGFDSGRPTGPVDFRNPNEGSDAPPNFDTNAYYDGYENSTGDAEDTRHPDDVYDEGYKQAAPHGFNAGYDYGFNNGEGDARGNQTPDYDTPNASDNNTRGGTGNNGYNDSYDDHYDYGYKFGYENGQQYGSENPSETDGYLT